MPLVKTVEMRVLAKAGDAQEQLDELAAKADRLDGDSVRMRFRVDDGDAKAHLDDMRARADRLGFKDVSIKVRVDGAGRAIADLMAVKREEEKVSGGGVLGRLGGLLSGAPGALSSAAGGLPVAGGLAGAGGGAGLAVVVAGAAALVTELVGVASGFAAAGTGAGAFALLAMPAVKKVETAYQALSKAQQAYQQAQAKEAADPTKAHQSAVSAAGLNLKLAQEQMAKLPPSAQMAVTGIQKLSASFHALSAAFAPQAFKVFADGLKVVGNLLPHVAPFASTFASGLDKLLQQAGKFTQSKGFSDWIKQFHSLEGPAIAAIGHGIGEVANSFGKLMTVMSGKDVGHAINIAFSAISGTIGAVTSSVRFLMNAWDGMGLAIQNVRHSLSSVGGVFSHLGSAVVSAFKGIGQGAVSFQNTVDHAFTAVIHGAEQMVSGVIHTVSSLAGKIKGAFAGAAGWLVSAGKAIIQGLINGIESMLGPLEAVASKVAGVVSKIAGWLGIHSPSTVFYGYGQNIVAGLIGGVGSQLPALRLQMAGVTSAVTAGAGHAGYGYGGGGGSIVVNFNGVVGDKYAVAQQIHQVMRDYKRDRGGAVLGLG